MSGQLHIAMVGQKGLPATYGGIEHHVEQVGSRLVDLGHQVSVYCRPTYRQGAALTMYRGMRLITTSTVGTKHLDAIVHSVTSTAHALRSGCDVIHYHALGPGLVAPLPRYASSAKVVLTVHGLDHQRAKWSWQGRAALGAAHWMSGRVPDEVVTVSRTLAHHYWEAFGREATYIPNGVAEPGRGQLSARLREDFGLVPERYVLFVGRLVPEKRPDLLIRAMRALPDDVKLVVVGDSSFTDDYTQSLRRLAADDPRVIFTGYVFMPELGQLYANAAVFVQPSALEGLPLTLLEALSYDIPVVASDIPPHVEVLGAGNAGHQYFREGDGADLARTLETILENRPTAAAAATSGTPDVLSPYSWDAAAASLSELYQRIARPGMRSAPAPSPV